MSGLSMFMKENKVKRENFKIVATKSLRDENGKPIEFEFKPLTTRENEAIKDECSKMDKVGNISTNRNSYMAKVLSRCCVYPNLNDASLQDSYGVRTAEQLLLEMVDEPTEFSTLFETFASKNGYSDTDLVKEVKN